MSPPESLWRKLGFPDAPSFPHLHVTLRKDGKPIDPFTGRGMESECGQSGTSEWAEAATESIAYSAPGVFNAGFSDTAPSMETVMAGTSHADVIPPSADAMIFWAQLYGVKEGDVVHTKLVGASSGVLAESKTVIDKNQVEYLTFVGKKRTGDSLPEDVFSGAVTLKRALGGSEDTLIDYAIEFGKK